MQLSQGKFSTISYDEESKILTLVWSENTANMEDFDFQNVNLAFAEYAEEYKAQRLVVHVEKFGHTFSTDLDEWRAQTIVPKYHNAGVKKFAFVHGEGFDEPDSGAANEGENFVTRHFATLENAQAWLSES